MITSPTLPVNSITLRRTPRISAQSRINRFTRSSLSSRDQSALSHGSVRARTLRTSAERLVKAAFRAVAGETASQEQIDKVREILERAMRDLDGMRDKP